MKYMYATATIVFISLTAWAVSLDFPQFSAVTIGDVMVVSSDENTETSVQFSGEGLEALYKILPEVPDAETGGISETIRGFDIFSSSEGSPSQKINFSCEKTGKSVNCQVTITKGAVAG